MDRPKTIHWSLAFDVRPLAIAGALALGGSCTGLAVTTGPVGEAHRSAAADACEAQNPSFAVTTSWANTHWPAQRGNRLSYNSGTVPRTAQPSSQYWPQ